MSTLKSMRDLINLTESVGLANRRPGQTFANTAGEVMTFQGLDFYPESGKYTPDQLKRALAALARKGIDSETMPWVNQANRATGAFAIASFTTSGGQPYYVGRWFGSINPNRTQNNWPNADLPGNFRLQTGAARKEDSDLQPSKILTQFQSNTPESIAAQVAEKFGQDSDQYRAIAAFMQQDLPSHVPAGNLDKAAFQDYFGELLGPIALVQGKRVGGNALEAADIFFGPGSGYGSCVISFNPNTIGSLYDSLLVNDNGRQIKLSSKGKEGATASVTNLSRSLEELQASPQGKKLSKTYQDTVGIIQTIQREGQSRAPLALAEQFGIINSREAQQVLDLKGVGPQDIVGSGRLSRRLEKLYTERQERSKGNIIPFYHLLAAIAFRVADHVNQTTDFSEAASAILNHAALVQLYTTVTKQGNDFVIKMDAKYPSEAITGVILDPGKVYFSSGNKGNFTFKILKNGAKPNDVSPADPVDVTEPAEVDVKTQLDAVVNKPRLTGPGARAARSQQKPRTTAAVLGREKRRR